MPTNPDHKPEAELKKPLEGELGRESGTPDKPETRPEDLPARVDAGMQAVEAHLRIVPTAIDEAATRLGEDPKNLVKEPDASELAASKQQLDSAGHQMHDIASALSGNETPTEPALLQTEPQISPMTGTNNEPAQLPVDTGPRVDGVRTPVTTAPEPIPIAPLRVGPPEPAVPPTMRAVDSRPEPVTPPLPDIRSVQPVRRDLTPVRILPPETSHPTAGAPPIPVFRPGPWRPPAADNSRFAPIQADADDSYPDVAPLPPRAEPARVRPEPADAVDGVRQVRGNFYNRTEPEPLDAQQLEARNAEIGNQINGVFEKRSQAGEGKKAEKPALFDVGAPINLPKHLSVTGEAKWKVTKIVNGTYLLEQKGKNGEKEFLVTDEKELATQGVSDNKYSKGYNEFRNAVFDTKAKEADAPTEGKDKKKPLAIKVDQIVRLSPKLLGDKKMRSDDMEWDVTAKDAGIFFLSQEDQFGNVSSLVLTEAELRDAGITSSKAKSEKEISEKKIDLKALSPDQLNTLWDDVVAELNDPQPGVMSPAKKYGSSRKELNLVLREIKRIRQEKARATIDQPETEQVKPEAAEQSKRTPNQSEYYRAIHETALQQALQEARNNPEDYAKLAGSVVGATMRYTAEGGASLIDRQGQVVKELGKDKVDEARLSILKDRLVPDMIRNGMRVGAELQNRLDTHNKTIARLEQANETDNGEYEDAKYGSEILKRRIQENNEWMQDLKNGKGNFGRDADGIAQVVGPDNTMIKISEDSIDRHQNIVSLQTEKLFAARTAIKELAGSKSVPEAFKADVQQGNFSFTITDDMTMMVEIVGGKNDGNRFQVQPKITEGILDGSLPKGDASPDLADLHKQTDPDKTTPDKDSQDSNATEDEVEDKKPRVLRNTFQEKITQNEGPKNTEVSKASDAMRQRILALGSSEWQDQVKPLIESMQREGTERLSIRADNKGNLYAGVMSPDGKHMVKRLTPRIEANSQIGRLLNNDPSMGVLRRLEHTVKEEEPQKKPDTRQQRGTELPTVGQRNEKGPRNVRNEINSIVEGLGKSAFVNEASMIKLGDLVRELKPAERIPATIDIIKNSNLKYNSKDIIDLVMFAKLDRSQMDVVSAEVMPDVFQAAGYDESIKMVNFIRDSNTKAKAMRRLIELNGGMPQSRNEQAA